MFRDANGAIYGVCGISTDITDRKRAEEEVEAERLRLQILVDTLPVGILVVDESNQAVVLNKEHRRLTGMAMDSIDSL
ncbi:MAG: PAS domain-containing protein, partial [Proteobacteria bacterium]|nr:PAS domain-containing protein [Pseudomonadota bacterium]